MPTYEYACKLCGHHFETFQSMNDAPLRRCPACKKAGLKRLISGGAGIIFKGTGFYETDYKRSSSPKTESGSDGSKAATTSDKKPAETKTATQTKAPAKTEAAKPKAAAKA